MNIKRWCENPRAVFFTNKQISLPAKVPAIRAASVSSLHIEPARMPVENKSRTSKNKSGRECKGRHAKKHGAKSENQMELRYNARSGKSWISPWTRQHSGESTQSYRARSSVSSPQIGLSDKTRRAGEDRDLLRQCIYTVVHTRTPPTYILPC